ncbi:MAG: putative rane protein [Ilumatobacteraceae bacterium]|nr:putative rane protein [Ilumatobacteraceae bacterium]
MSVLSRTPVPTRVLLGILGAAGVAHFVAPKTFDDIVPEVLPGSARLWTYISGVAELGVAVGVAIPRTRRLGALAAAALFVAVFPANIKMAIDWSDRSLGERIAAYGRLPLQIPLVWLAVTVMRRSAHPAATS